MKGIIRHSFEILLIWLCCTAPTVQVQAQPIPCDERLYLFTSEFIGTPTAAHINTINPANGRLLPTLWNNTTGTFISAVGYNVYDGYIYGFNTTTYELFRIGADGAAVNLGVPNGIDKTLVYYAGAVSPLGRTLFLVGRDRETDIDRKLVSVNILGPTYGTGFVSIVADWKTRIESIVFDPDFGLLLGFDRNTRRLVNISSGGFVTSNRYEVNNQLVTIGSLFFTSQGQLYGYGGTGTTETHFYAIDRNDGKATLVSSGPIGRVTDGCSCPYRITFDKTVSPREALPCTEVTYRYRITNTSGTSFTQVEIRDSFPEGFVITDIRNLSPIGEVQSGIGSNKLLVRRLHILLGDNEFEVKVRTSPQTGVYRSQAVMTPTPLMLGGFLRSDDPAIAQSEAPTELTVIPGEQIIADTLLYLCPGGTRRLEANRSAGTYQWSNGATAPTQDIQVPGTYSVIATTECGFFYDTVQVLPVQTPLFIKLEAPPIIEQGDRIALQYTTNGSNLQFQWRADDPTLLSCTDCPRPLVSPLRDAVYQVTVTDANGCSASDEVLVKVIPVRNIFGPTAFSPNGDGINDVFYLQGKTNARILHLRIFDRWGNQVFQIRNGYLNDPAFGWNGEGYNRTAESGIYIFTAELEFEDNARKRISGELQLLR